VNTVAPQVAVIMSVYNGARYLREAVDSILKQSFIDFEFIIINDGSTDETQRIIDSYEDKRIISIPQDNRGLATSLNRGIKVARAEYVARIDADDMALPNRLQQQVLFLDNNPTYVIVGSFMEFITADGHPIYIQETPLSSTDIKKSIESASNPFLHPSVMIRKIPLLNCGLYNEALLSGQDRDLYYRLMKEGEMANLPICLGKYRLTPGAITNLTSRQLKTKMGVVDKAHKGNLTDGDRQLLRNIIFVNDKSKDYSLYHLRVGRAFLHNTNNIKEARRHLISSICKWPLNYSAWRNLLFAYSPKLIKSILIELQQYQKSCRI